MRSKFQTKMHNTSWSQEKNQALYAAFGRLFFYVIIVVWARLSGCDKCVRERIWVGGRKVGAHSSPTIWWSQLSRWPDHACRPTLAPLRTLYNPGSWSQDSGDICFLLTQALKLNRKMCLALNWVPLAGNRETLGSSECQGWQVLHQSCYLRLWPLWSPGGTAGWVTDSPPPSLTFGNLLARVTAVLFPKQAMSFQLSQSLLILFPTPWTLSSPPFPSATGRSHSSFKGQFLCHLLCEPLPTGSLLPKDGQSLPQPP